MSSRFYRSSLLVICVIVVSLLGLSFLVILTFSPSTQIIDISLQKRLVSIVYGGICILGIIESVYPNRCSQIYYFRIRNIKSYRNCSKDKKVRWRGHHPVCDKFSQHIIQLFGKEYCAGCLGMRIGAVIALLALALGLIIDVNFSIVVIVFWLGVVMVAASLLQNAIFSIPRGIRLSFNILFVLGTWGILVGINRISGSTVLNLYFFTLIFYWLITRMILSQWKHQKICSSCGMKSCGFN